MDKKCQHCGAKLPWVVDAFCSTCGKALDEFPEPLSTESDKSGVGFSNGLLLMIASMPAIFIGTLCLIRGNWEEGIYTGVFGFFVFLVGAFKSGKSNKSSVCEKDEALP